MSELIPAEVRMSATRGAFAAVAETIVSNMMGGDAKSASQNALMVGGSVMLADLLSRKVILPIEGKKASKKGVRTVNQLLVEPLLAGGIAQGIEMAQGLPFNPMGMAVVAAYDVAGGAMAHFAGVGQKGAAGVDSAGVLGF